MPYMMCSECDVEPVKVDGERCATCKQFDGEMRAWEAEQRHRIPDRTPADDVWCREQNFQDDDMVLFLEGAETKNDIVDDEHVGMQVFLKFTKIDWRTIKNDSHVERHELMLPLGRAVPYFWRRP